MTRDEAIKAFQEQLSKTVPGPLHEADDLLNLPPEIYRRIWRQLELEELEEALRSRG